MSQLPQIRRLLVEDFMDQKDWISKLFTPLNTFMESVYAILNSGITVKDNMIGDVQTIDIGYMPTVAVNYPLRWDKKVAPKAIIVGNATKKSTIDETLTHAVAVQWKYDFQAGLRLVNIVGITPTNTDHYLLTLVIIAG